jgi:hypothetical protein
VTRSSVTDFKFAKPFSNCAPTIFSQFKKSPMALATKLARPDMLHSTKVRSPSGLNELGGVGGLEGLEEVELDPDEFVWTAFGDGHAPLAYFAVPGAKMAPTPSAFPSKLFLAAGSRFAHGDQVFHLWKSLM